MTEEQEVTEEIQEVPEQETPPKPAGFVSLEGLPEETAAAIQGRFDELTRQAKFAERDKELLQQHNAKLDSAFQRMEERLGSVEEQATGNRYEEVREQYIQAMEEMDYGQAADLQAQMREMERSREVQEQAQEQVQEPAADLTGFVNQWGTELDETGNLKRPWAMPNHPDHNAAVGEAVSLTRDPVFMNGVTTAEDFLKKFDQHWSGRSEKQATPEVLSGNASISPKPEREISLTADQKRIAERMGIPFDRYAKQVQAMQEGKI